jgi:hypothetical protein
MLLGWHKMSTKNQITFALSRKGDWISILVWHNNTLASVRDINEIMTVSDHSRQLLCDAFLIYMCS